MNRLSRALEREIEMGLSVISIMMGEGEGDVLGFVGLSLVGFSFSHIGWVVLCWLGVNVICMALINKLHSKKCM